MSIFAVQPSKRTVTDDHPLTENFSTSLPAVTSFSGPSTFRYSIPKPNTTFGFYPSTDPTPISNTPLAEYSQDAFVSKNDMFKNLKPSAMSSDWLGMTNYDTDDQNFVNSFSVPHVPNNSPDPEYEAKYNKQVDFQNSYFNNPNSSNLESEALNAVEADALEGATASTSALDFAPGILGSTIINETTNASNQQRSQAAQMSPDYDAKLLASMQNTQQSQIAGIGSTATIISSGVGAAIGSSFGPIGSVVGSTIGAAAGLGATEIAQSSVSPQTNIINDTGGGVTSAQNSA